MPAEPSGQEVGVFCQSGNPLTTAHPFHGLAHGPQSLLPLSLPHKNPSAQVPSVSTCLALLFLL